MRLPPTIQTKHSAQSALTLHAWQKKTSLDKENVAHGMFFKTHARMIPPLCTESFLLMIRLHIGTG